MRWYLCASDSERTVIQGGVCRNQKPDVQICRILRSFWIKPFCGKTGISFFWVSPSPVENEFGSLVWILSKPVEIHKSCRWGIIMTWEVYSLPFCARHLCLLGCDPVCSPTACNIKHSKLSVICCLLWEGSLEYWVQLLPGQTRARSKVKISLLVVISSGSWFRTLHYSVHFKINDISSSSSWEVFQTIFFLL